MDTKKKLYRSNKDQKLSGVCAGIAEYSDIDVTLVRLGFALFALFYGFTFWIYLIMAIVVPKDPGNNEF